MKQFLSGAFGVLFFFGMIGAGLLMLGAGAAGIEHKFGWGWSIAAIISAVAFRITLPISVGVFFCANEIWGRHWVFALLLAAPGILIMIPGTLADIIGALRSSRS